MSEDDDTEDEPAVPLGDGEPVDGAPIVRVAERLMWGIEKSEVVSREGDTVVRTPDGPRALEAVLGDVDHPYFATRQEFLDAVETAIGSGPVPTAEEA